MTSIFHALHALSSVFPLLLLLLMANGLLAPALYGLATGTALDVGTIRNKAKAGDRWARYAWLSWVVLAVAGALLVLFIVFAWWAKGRTA